MTAYLKSYVLILTHHRCRCGDTRDSETLFGIIADGNRRSLGLIKPGATIYDIPLVREQRVSRTEACEMCISTIPKVKMPEPADPGWKPRAKLPTLIDVDELSFE